MSGKRPAIVAISGPKNSGKTALVESLVARLVESGLRFVALKHDAHAHMAMDRPGKDTWRYREAGAQHVAIAGPLGTVLLEYAAPFEADAAVDSLLERFTDFDLVLAEGFKDHALPRIVLQAVDGQIAGRMRLSHQPLRDDSQESCETSVPLSVDVAFAFVLEQAKMSRNAGDSVERTIAEGEPTASSRGVWR